MKIELTNVGKRYNQDWIFRHLTFRFEPGKSYAITGPNGSGKSTLLQLIAGISVWNEGRIHYIYNGEKVDPGILYRYVSLSAPYLELPEEMTLLEFFSFHTSMKRWLPGIDTPQVIRLLGLEHAAHRPVYYFSSGMKQRVKLAQAVFSDVPLVLLDEPLTNLDEEGVHLYNRLVNEYGGKRTFIISSNDAKEYTFCTDVLDIRNYKQVMN